MSDLISREAAIDYCYALINAENPSDPSDEWNYSQERINQTEVILHHLECMPSAQPEWIPVTERLPEEEKKTYWVCTDGGDQHECRWTNTNPIWTHLTTNWHWNIFDIPQYSRVIAWMPLPDPYREVSE